MPLLVDTKTPGAIWPLHDFQHVNAFLEHRLFKMEPVVSLVRQLRMRDNIFFIGISSAYRDIEIAPRFRTLLGSASAVSTTCATPFPLAFRSRPRYSAPSPPSRPRPSGALVLRRF